MEKTLLAAWAFLSWFPMAHGLIAQTFPAYFIFGDSLVDVGNNNYIATVAKADSLPHGIDFPAGPTGRFCNGKIVPDFLCNGWLLGLKSVTLVVLHRANSSHTISTCEFFSLPFPPPYLAPTTRGQALLQGVNYASAAGGILRKSGINFIGRVDLDTQLDWFTNNVQALNTQLGELRTQDLLSKSLFSTTIGSNDYTNNYLLKPLGTSMQYTPAQFQQLVLTKFSSQLTQLYEMGARTVLVLSLGPLGCIPRELVAHSVNGECLANVNSLASNFNDGLQSLVSDLNSKLDGSQFIYIDIFQAFLAYCTNPKEYGFKFATDACCGGGRFKAQLLCLPMTKACPDRNDYIFWDAFHPTESANKLLANLIINILRS